MLYPHRLTATIVLTFRARSHADELEERIRAVLSRDRARFELERVADRPPLAHGKASRELAGTVQEVAEEWGIPFRVDSSVWPSVAGLAPDGTPVLCGFAPPADNVATHQERVRRVGLVERTLLLAELLHRLEAAK